MKKLIAVIGAACAALSLAACGDSFTDGDAEAGKQAFIGNCGSCHALKDAGTKGIASVAGVPVPNLDDAFRSARESGWQESQFQGVVNRWITHAAKPMPRDIVVGQKRKDVAAYVAAVAGRSEESAVVSLTPLPPITPPGGPYPGKTGVPKPTEPTTPSGDSGNAQNDLVVDADPSGALAFTQTSLEGKSGSLTLTIKNESQIPHNVAIKGNGVQSDVSKTVTAGGSSSITVDLQPGDYEFYCAVPGHEEAGMKGTLKII